MCLSVLFNSLLQLDSVDLDAQQFMLEASIKCKCVIILYFSSWWLLLEQPHLCTVSAVQYVCVQ
jgi:hypothetical protein